MPQSGSDSPRSSSPCDSLVIRRFKSASWAFPPAFLDTDSTDGRSDDGHDGPSTVRPVAHSRSARPPVRNPLDDIEVLRISADGTVWVGTGFAPDDTPDYFGHVIPEEAPSKSRMPFQKWVKTLHRRHLKRQTISGAEFGMSFEKGPVVGRDSFGHSGYHRPSSDSSFAFVTGTRSATVSLASGSLMGRSRRNTVNTVKSLKGYSRTDRSSRASISARLSEDSHFGDATILLDPAVAERSIHRRRILEELISTEEGYIRDIKFLMNVSSARGI